MFAAPNKVVEKFGISIPDWSPALPHPLRLYSFLLLTGLLANPPLVAKHGPFEAEREGRRRKGLRYPLRGCQEAAVLTGGFPEVVYPERCVSTQCYSSYAHNLLTKVYFHGNHVTRRKQIKGHPHLRRSTMRRTSLTSHMSPS